MSAPLWRINPLCRESYNYASSRGFRSGIYADHVRQVPESLALIHEEVSEALREWRKDDMFPNSRSRGDGKPEGMPAELADIVLRVCDLAGALNIDLDAAIRAVRAWSEENRLPGHGDVRNHNTMRYGDHQ